MTSFTTLALLASLALLSLAFCQEPSSGAAAAPTAEVHEDEETSLSSFPMTDLFMSDGVMRAVSMAGAVATAVAGLTAILSFILPFLGVRTCMFTGGCDDSDDTQTNSVYDQQGYVSNCTQSEVSDPTSGLGYAYPYNNGYKRRSLEYVGPILKALSRAYDKYAPIAQARKLDFNNPKPHKQ